MKVRVLFFATCRTVFGCKETEITLPSAASVKDLKMLLSQREPAWAGIESKVSVAVNAEYVTDDEPLHDGDEVALIPPVSGGS